MDCCVFDCLSQAYDSFLRFIHSLQLFYFTSIPSGSMLHESSAQEEEEGNMCHENYRLEMEAARKRWVEDCRKSQVTKEVAELAVRRVMEKLNVLMIQEPAVLVGVEEHFHWIQKELSRVPHYYDLTEELMDVAYDFEDVIDDLVLKAAAKQIREMGIRERCFLLIRIHMKLAMIKSKIPHLPLYGEKNSAEAPNNLEETEWSSLLPVSSPCQEIAKAVSPLKGKLSALLDLNSLHPKAKKKSRHVLDALESLESSVEALEFIVWDDKAKVWMENLSDVSLSAMDIVEGFIDKNAQLRERSWAVRFSGNLKSQKLAVEMDRLYAVIRDLSMSRPMGNSKTAMSESEFSESDHLTSFNDDHQTITEEPDFASFAEDVHAMTARLLAHDKSCRLIAIMGMQGMGKTTLGKLIFNNKAVVDHFPSRSWPSTSDSRQIVLDMVEQLMNYKVMKDGVTYNDIQEMMQKLKAFFTDNRSLIVIDDPPRLHFWEELLEALADTSNGSRIIWITRNMSIPPNIKTRADIDLHPLRLRDDKESWALFNHALKSRTPSKVQGMKESTVRSCEGLPLLIINQAKSLSTQDTTIKECSAALQDQEKLWSNTICRIHQDLPLYMRRCFFSLTLFPHDFDIPARRLTTMWVAEHLVQTEGTDHNDDPEDVAERCLHLLIAQGMIQVATKKLNGNVKTVRLPHSLARYWSSKAQQSTAVSDHHHHIHTRSEFFPGNNVIRRLVDHLDTNDVTFDHIHGGGHNKKISSASLRQHYQHAISFRSFHTQERVNPAEYIGEFIRRCISSNCLLSLLVLDLENVFRPKLPEALGELTQLRYLGLRSTSTEKLPSSVSKLLNLRTLDMKHTNISTLPNSIWELQKLRHLYLSEDYTRKVLSSSRPSIGCLMTLQTLCGLRIDEETLVRDGLNRILGLRKLGLRLMSSSQVQAQGVIDWIPKLKHLRSLRIKSTSDDHSCEAWGLDLKPLIGLNNLSCIYLYGRLRNHASIASLFPASLVDVTLSGSKLTEDPMQSLDKLPNLRSLKLYAESYIGKSMCCPRGGFPELRVLKLWKLDQLHEWKVEKGALQALRDLEIRYSAGRHRLVVPEELSERSPSLKIDVLQLAP